MQKNKVPILLVLLLGLVGLVTSGCQTAPRVPVAYVAAADTLNELEVDAAEAIASLDSPELPEWHGLAASMDASAASAGDISNVLELYREARASYEAVVGEGRWSERVLPALRYALSAYGRLRELVPQLPAPPRWVSDLLGPC